MDSVSHSLRQKVFSIADQALKSGALQPIQTQQQTVSDGGLQFCVRVVDSLTRKEKAQKPKSARPGKVFNPFLPYEEALCVTHLSETHVCLLNKFNVVDHHILMVTRDYEAQDTWLTQADFSALAQCLVQMEGLGFYNGGTQAGASQHHKHLQLIPFSSPLGIQELPIAQLIHSHRDAVRQSGQLSLLPYRHSLKLLDEPWTLEDASKTAKALLETYYALLETIGLDLKAAKPNIPYNLLVTQAWMLAVPRSQESYRDIGVNALGYAGMLLAKDADTLVRLKQIGPMHLLTTVGCPAMETSAVLSD